MAYVIAKIGSKELISSQTITFTKEDLVSIYPFSESEEFRILFQHELVGEGPMSTLMSTEGLSVTITHRQSFRDGRPSANINVGFASDENFSYYFSFTLSLVGSRERYALNLSYSILRGARQ